MGICGRSFNAGGHRNFYLFGEQMTLEEWLKSLEDLESELKEIYFKNAWELYE